VGLGGVFRGLLAGRGVVLREAAVSIEAETRELEAADWERRGEGPKAIWRRPGGGSWTAHHQAYKEMRREKSAAGNGSAKPGGRVGLELRRIREEKGLTVEELAKKSGVSVTTIRVTERGTREPSGDTVARLAKPLGLTFDEVWRLQGRRG